MSLEDQDTQIYKRAVLARRTTTIDTMVWLRGRLRDVRIDPRALSYNESDVAASDQILLHVSDLLDLAVFAYYELQKRDQNRRMETRTEDGKP